MTSLPSHHSASNFTGAALMPRWCCSWGWPVDELVQLVHPAVGDDALHLVRIGDVHERIAVDQHEVGELARLDRAAGEAKSLGGIDRRRLQRLVRGHAR